MLDVDPGNRDATIVADLAAADTIADDTFDCFVLTQTLQYIYDLEPAVGHVHRILRPGGTVLCSVPAVSRVDRQELESEYWRFTAASCTSVFSDAFAGGDVRVRTHGNVLAAIGFLTGLSKEELSDAELDVLDELYPVVVGIRARKA